MTRHVEAARIGPVVLTAVEAERLDAPPLFMADCHVAGCVALKTGVHPNPLAIFDLAEQHVREGHEDGTPVEWIATRYKLAISLLHHRAPKEMVTKAYAGAYDDYLSTSAFNILDLVTDANNAGLVDISDRAKDGDFDATKAESDAWAASPDGRATFAEFVDGLGKKYDPPQNRAQRRAAARHGKGKRG